LLLSEGNASGLILAELIHTLNVLLLEQIVHLLLVQRFEVLPPFPVTGSLGITRCCVLVCNSNN